MRCKACNNVTEYDPDYCPRCLEAIEADLSGALDGEYKEYSHHELTESLVPSTHNNDN
jgi:predicted amidophosphoribosyltransferase